MCSFTLSLIGQKTQEKKQTVYIGFLDLEKAGNRVNKEAL